MKNLLKLTTIVFLGAAMVLVSCKARKNKNKSGDNVPSIIVSTDFSIPESNDDFKVSGVKMKGDILSVYVSYSGGCEDHEFTLHTNKMYMKSLPPKLGVFLKHNANGDACKMLKMDTLQFNMKDCQYPSTEEDYTLILNMNNWKDPINYIY